MFEFPRRKDLNVVLFSSTLGIESSLEEITLKLSEIFRYLLLARVSNLLVVDDSNGLYKLIKEIHRYALTPPYLKRKIPKKRALSKVGLLAPMNVYYHVVHRFPVEGEVRIGKNGDFGLKERLGKEFDTVLITDSTKMKYVPYQRVYYDGFQLRKIKLPEVEKMSNVIVGSRSGKDPFLHSEEIRKLYEAGGLTLILGPPKGELIRNLGEKYISRSYNFVPRQGVSDVRVEEALAFSLAVLNSILK